MSTLGSNVHKCRRHNYLVCQVWVMWILSGTEAEQHWISHSWSGFFFRKRMAMDLLSQFSSQIGNSCEMSVPPEVFWGNIPFRHHELVVAKKRQFFWTKLAKLQNSKGLKTDKSRWQQDHWLHFPCWHWSSEVEYAQAWQKHYELSSPSLDLEGVVPLTMSSSS